MRRMNGAKQFKPATVLLACIVMAALAAPLFSADEPVVGIPSPTMTAPDSPQVPPAPSPAPQTTESDATPPVETAAQIAQEAGGDHVIPLKADEKTGIENLEGQNLINVTVENETLENVVNMFARISGANIVTTSADLGGTVTVNLRGVEWKPALSSILDVHDLALIEKLPGSGVYTIVPKPSGSTEPLIVETLFLNFTTVPEMGPLVRSMLGAVSNAAVSEFPSRNAMVIKTTEPNMREIRTLVQQMDVPGRQVVVETKFMELTDSASKKLGIRWDSLDEWSTSLSLQPLNYSREIARNSSRNSENNYADTKRAAFDQDGKRYSDPTDWEWVDGNPDNPDDGFLNGTVPPGSASHETLEEHTSTDSSTYSKDTAEAQSAVLDVAEFKTVISALEKTAGVSVISNPKLIVASGSRDAYFTVGEREPIIRTEVQRGTQDSPGDQITAELDSALNTEYIKQGYLQTGIHLQVIPVVKTEDLIEASIEPKLVRRLLPDKVVGENSWPRIAVKEIKTTFTLRSGQTVAIGGLTDTSDDKQVTKIPLLGDIPLLGKYLFSHTADIKKQIETIIFVTLSLAEANTLYREAGIPEDAELVHKKLIQSEHRRRNFESELDGIRKATQEEERQAKEDEAAKRSRTNLKRHK
ncbi:MAG: hypothetical protein K8T26_12025 [Lentisphaerae bacterium]|nr:hypothetical protein [Lentisphaerota bacterium]